MCTFSLYRGRALAVGKRIPADSTRIPRKARMEQPRRQRRNPKMLQPLPLRRALGVVLLALIAGGCGGSSGSAARRTTTLVGTTTAPVAPHGRTVTTASVARRGAAPSSHPLVTVGEITVHMVDPQRTMNVGGQQVSRSF